MTGAAEARARGLPAGDTRHGTRMGYGAGCHCDRCLLAACEVDMSTPLRWRTPGPGHPRGAMHAPCQISGKKSMARIGPHPDDAGMWSWEVESPDWGIEVGLELDCAAAQAAAQKVVDTWRANP